jgi:hypothetical protein
LGIYLTGSHELYFACRTRFCRKQAQGMMFTHEGYRIDSRGILGAHGALKEQLFFEYSNTVFG